MMYDFETR
jgi:WD40 repeat protein